MTKEFTNKIINYALARGASFAEVYYEDSYTSKIQVIGQEVTQNSFNNEYGVGIRIFHDLEENYAYTNDLSEENLLDMISKMTSGEGKEKIKLQEERSSVINPVLENIFPERFALCMKINKAMEQYDSEITQTISVIYENTKNVIVSSSKGKYQRDTRTNIRISSQAIASKDGITQTGSDSYGFHQGYEMFKEFDYLSFANKIAKTAITMLHAEEMVGGDMMVIIHNGFGGVIFHEACGHSLEASSVAKNTSVFSNMLGKEIASNIVNAVDDGTIENAWGSINMDDEGTPPKKNKLIENGVLKGYMIDKINGQRMNMDITGSARRESYKYMPTSRMTNTYIENGKSTFDEIIKNTKQALFAKSLGGGSVNPATGDFNFAVLEGYMVVDGKITKPVRGATLVGNGREILKRIDMIADNLAFGHGFCGAESGSIPVNVGQPTIRITHMTVGGRGQNNG